MRSIGKSLREVLLVIAMMTGFVLVYGLVDWIEQGEAWSTARAE